MPGNFPTPPSEEHVDEAIISIADSLKRIADVVETLAGANTDHVCDFIETVAKELKVRGVD